MNRALGKLGPCFSEPSKSGELEPGPRGRLYKPSHPKTPPPATYSLLHLGLWPRPHSFPSKSSSYHYTTGPLSQLLPYSLS